MSRKRPGAAGDHAVGYGKPPKHTRFRKGQSGNPRGRPKGVRNMSTLLGDVLRQQISVTEQGGTRRISKREGVLTALVAKALRGDVKTIVTLVNLADAVDAPEKKDGLQLLIDEIRDRGATIHNSPARKKSG